MDDVARYAGVSTASVSRVLSGGRPVTDEVARRVHTASKELGYRIHATAQSLRRQQTGIVGMVVPHITNPFFPVVVDAVEHRLHADHDLTLLLCDSHNDPTLERERLASLQRGRVDGLLVVPAAAVASAAAVADVAVGLPVAQVDRWVDGVDVDVIATDHRSSMALVVSHLAATGCHTLAFIGGMRTGAAARERHAEQPVEVQLVTADNVAEFTQ